MRSTGKATSTNTTDAKNSQLFIFSVVYLSPLSVRFLDTVLVNSKMEEVVWHLMWSFQ